MELAQYGLTLLFRNEEIIFLFKKDRARGGYLVNPVLYFLSYRTFVNYNLLGFALDPPRKRSFLEGQHIQFRLQRMVQVETEWQRGTETVKGFYHAPKDEWLTVAVDGLAEYLRVLNPPLYYALAFYLIGCENPRYFLIEFYKAVEAISHALGGERALLKVLAPYGVKKENFKDFGRMCNDMRLAPLDIGRHAPQPGASLYTLDLRNLLVEPRSREVFESSTVFCRHVIDAYMALLGHEAAQQGAAGDGQKRAAPERPRR